MADYWGVEQIGKRLGVHRNTVLAWRERYGLLMYRRRRGPRVYWYSNDQLLHTWEISRCAAELKHDRERRQAQAVAR